MSIDKYMAYNFGLCTIWSLIAEPENASHLNMSAHHFEEIA